MRAVTGGASSTPRDTPRVIWSWALYDWANSSFTTLVVTFIYSTYFTQALAPDAVTGTAWWSWGIGLSAVLIALLSPILGAAADRAARRKRYLAAATGVCVAGTAALTFVAPGTAWAPLIALAIFVVANVAFELGTVFSRGEGGVPEEETRLGLVLAGERAPSHWSDPELPSDLWETKDIMERVVASLGFPDARVVHLVPAGQERAAVGLQRGLQAVVRVRPAVLEDHPAVL